MLRPIPPTALQYNSVAEYFLPALPTHFADLSMRPWRKWSQPTRDYLPEPWRTWVLDPGSLTKRLIDASEGNFSVQPLRQYWGRATLSEARLLGIDPRQQVYVREVALICKDKPWVYARSIIPRSTMTGEESQLKYLGSKPLGSLLFTHKNMQRGDIQISPLYNHEAWARRSLFYLSGKALLVNEIFVSDMFKA